MTIFAIPRQSTKAPRTTHPGGSLAVREAFAGNPPTSSVSHLRQSAEAVRTAREAAGLSLKDVARACGWFSLRTTATSMRRIESGLQEISPAEAVVVSGVTGVDIAVLRQGCTR